MVSQKEMIVFLFVVVVLIFLGGVLLKILQSVPFIGGILGQIEGYVPQLTLPVDEEDKSNAISVNDLMSIAPEDMPITSGIVGCSIAKTIRDDFVLNGEKEKNHGEKLDFYGSGLNYLASAKFKIDVDPATKNYRKDSELTTTQMNKLLFEKGCADNIPGALSPLPKCPEKLDENCINAHLGNMAFDEAKKKGICTDGKKIITPSSGGSQISFGNKACGGKASGWENANPCGECASGNDDRIENLGVSGSENKYNGIQYSLGPLYATDDSNFNAGNFPPDCLDQKCSPTYRWSLFWNSKEKKYKYEVRKIPEQKDLGKSVTINQMPNLLAYVFAGKVNPAYESLKYLRSSRENADRNSLAGPKFSDMREKVDFTFVADADKNLGEFIDEFKKSSSRPTGMTASVKISEGDMRYDTTVENEEWKESVEDCYGNDCYKTKPEIFKYNMLHTSILANNLIQYQSNDALKKFFGDIGSWFTTQQDLNLGDICKVNREKLYEINIKHNLGTNGHFSKDHKYNIVVKRYKISKEEKGIHAENCGGTEWWTHQCQFCWEPIGGELSNSQVNDAATKARMDGDACNNIANRGFKDCSDNYGIPAESKSVVTVWKDYSIIIVDLGEENPTTTTLKATTSSTTTTQSKTIAGK